ncbi:MAG: type 1 glutamine amidotransferase [Thermoanaerobacterales bacterium]|nr:type 1 glutamine amidotransferase [Thermoanaerobacterales bacterium]
MEPKRVLIVQNVSLEGPGFLGPGMAEAGWELDLRRMDRARSTLPATLDGYQALIILGGPMGANDEDRFPYLGKVMRLIRDAAQRDLPTLGICLGGQLIAKALGGRVAKSQRAELGWYRVSLTGAGQESPLFARFPESFPVFQWHEDAFEPPPGAELLVYGDAGCWNQAFRFGNRVYGLQFHLEVTPGMIEEWLRAYADDVRRAGGYGMGDRILEQTKKKDTMCRWLAGRFVGNWLDITGGSESGCGCCFSS